LQTVANTPEPPNAPLAKVYGFGFIVGLCGAVFGALGSFVFLGVLGHTSNGVINEGLLLTYPQYFFAAGCIGFLVGLKFGLKEARRKFLK
jgi:hypothetical protein